MTIADTSHCEISWTREIMGAKKIECKLHSVHCYRI